MDPITLGLLLGAGGGLLKNFLVDKPKEERQRKLSAAQTRYSPWTGIAGGNVEEANPLGDALAYGSTGAQLGALARPKEIKASVDLTPDVAQAGNSAPLVNKTTATPQTVAVSQSPEVRGMSGNAMNPATAAPYFGGEMYYDPRTGAMMPKYGSGKSPWAGMTGAGGY
jgi:hypothetical protein